MKLRTTLVAAATFSLVACGEPLAPRTTPTPGARTNAIVASDAQVVMSGLDNPRGITFGPEGALYVAEAGRGGSGPCYLILGTSVCYGPTGAVSRLWHGQQERVVTGLPSATNKGGRAEGPNGVALVGLSAMYVTIGLEADPAVRDATKPELAGFGQLVKVSPWALVPGIGRPDATQWEYVADISAFEVANNTDCGEIDSNPFALLTVPGGLLITDAGGNTVLRRDETGGLSVFASFSSSHTVPIEGRDCPLPDGYPAVQPHDMVPTSIVLGPDGAYYVSQLEGFPLTVGAANVWRVVPGSKPEVFLAGFTFIVSIAFDDLGNLYVLQNSDGPTPGAPGSLIRVATDGSRTTLLTGLTSPTSVAIGPDGGIYVSNFGSKVGVGTVLRIDP